MSSTFVERLLARVDGEAATIWLTVVFILGEVLPEPILRGAFGEVVARTGRLQEVWGEPGGHWRRVRWDPDQIESRVQLRPEIPAPGPLIEEALASRIDLAVDLGFQLWAAPLPGGRQLVIVQLHHAIGDARAQMGLCRRFWRAAAARLEAASGQLSAVSCQPGKGEKGPGDDFVTPAMTDVGVLGRVLMRPRAAVGLLRPKNRVLARRGLALGRDGEAAGRPLLATVTAKIGRDRKDGSGLFFGSLVAAVAATPGALDQGRPLRLRVPVDLRRELGIGLAVENACSAIPIELAPEAIRRARQDREALGRLVPDAIAQALRRQVHLGTALECWVVSRVADTAELKRHVRPDFVAPVRSSTLVTTYLGAVDRYAAPCPVPILNLWTHTPTWGANGLKLGDDLVVNLSAFEGLWSRERLGRFADDAAEWLGSHPGVSVERSL